MHWSGRICCYRCGGEDRESGMEDAGDGVCESTKTDVDSRVESDGE